MARRAAFQILFAFLLLAGQQAALVHSIWHLGQHGPALRLAETSGTAQSHSGDGKSSQSRLCDLHSTLGTLLAGDCGSLPAAVAVAAPILLTVYAAAWRVGEPATTPPSRAPPVLL